MIARGDRTKLSQPQPNVNMRNAMQLHLFQPGNTLSIEDQAWVLRAYVHRYTGDHKPQWAMKPRPNGKPYAVQFSDDADWLEHSYFKVRGNGDLDKRHKSCVSFPTWPLNPEHRKSLPRAMCELVAAAVFTERVPNIEMVKRKGPAG